jgi:hypothetical protein
MLLASALVACSFPADDAPEAVRSLTPKQRRARAEAVVDRAAADLRLAQMQARTDWADGVLERFCRDGACTTNELARPERILPADETRLLSFAVARRPSAAEIEIARWSGRVVRRARLRPATLMAVEPRLEPGRYLVTLNARWDSLEAAWVFGISV